MKYSIDDAIARAGGFGLFQWIMWGITAANFWPSVMVLYNLPFLNLPQIYKCPDGKGGHFECSKPAEICENGSLRIDVELDLNDERTIFNWITQLGIQCEPAYVTSLFGTLLFAGVIVSSLILAFTDRYGRRINLVVGSWLTLANFIGLIFVSNLYGKYVLMAIFGLMYFKNVQSYVMAAEFWMVKHKVYVTTAVLVFNGSMFPLTAVYFKFISNDWRYVFWFFLGIVIIITLASNFVPESPRFLYEKEEFDKARSVIIQMARMNGSESIASGNWKFENEPDDYDLHNPLNPSFMSVTTYTQLDTATQNSEISQLRKSLVKMDNSEKTSPFKLMKGHPIIFINLMIIMMSWIAISFNTYLLSFSIRNFGGNLYINAWAFGVCGILGKVLGGIVRNFTTTKISLLIMLSMVCIFGAGLIFFDNKYIMAICIGAIQIGLGGGFTLVYYVTTEYFPPLFTAFAFAVCQIGSRGFTMLSYVLSDLKAPIPMILLCSTGGVALISLIFLSKPHITSKKTRPIQDLQDQK